MPHHWNRKPVVAFADLGPLEQTVLEALWARGESSVQDIARTLERPLAYTTVMTTLDRLFKKRVLDRRQVERAFHYTPRYSKEDMQRQYASAFLDGFLNPESGGGEMLFSCLVDAVGQYDPALLDELEARIRQKKRQMERGKQS